MIDGIRDSREPGLGTGEMQGPGTIARAGKQSGSWKEGRLSSAGTKVAVQTEAGPGGDGRIGNRCQMFLQLWLCGA